LVVKGQDRCIQIGQRIEINETRTDQGVAEVTPVSDRAGKITANKYDFTILEYHLTVFNQTVPSTAMPHNPASGKKHPPLGSRRSNRRGE
jgi:hypothetical protein